MSEHLDTADGVQHAAGGVPEATSELARRSAMLDAVSYAATQIVGGNDWRIGIQELLDRLGRATKVGRVTLFELHSDADGRLVESCRYDWAEAGLASLSADLRYQSMPLVEADGTLDEWTRRRQQGEVIQAMLRDLTGYNRQVFLEHGTLSFVSVPVMLRSGCWGFLGFDDCRVEREWTAVEIDVLRTAAMLIASAIERAASDEKLRLSEERYALAARGANDGLWDWDLATGRAYFSPRLCEIFGVSAAVMGADPARLFDCVERDDAAEFRKYLDRRFRMRRRKFRFEARLRHEGDGPRRWIVARGLIVYGRDRPNRVVGSMRDITDVKLALDDLRESEMRVRAILDTAFDAIVTIDGAGIITGFNAAATRIFGFAPDEVIGRMLTETIIPHDRRADHTAGFQRYLAAGGPRMLGRVAEFEGLRADGTLVPIEISITEVPLADGRLFTGILRDLSERKRFERQLSESEKQRTALTRYFSPNMVDEMMEVGGSIEGVRALEATVLFADLIDFTAMSADAPGEQVIAFLRKFHEIAEDAVFGNEGTLEKYMGDGMMATFGTPRPGPRDATNAVACARRIVSAFNRWNRDRVAAALPRAQVSIGLHFGEVTLGEVGSKRRLEFTVIGDTVNAASRIEAMSRSLEVAIIASDTVVAAVRREDGDAVLSGFKDLGCHALRGRSGEVRLWGLTATALAEMDAP